MSFAPVASLMPGAGRV